MINTPISNQPKAIASTNAKVYNYRKIVIIVAIILLIPALYLGTILFPKTPVANDTSGFYFKNFMGVYEFIPQDCGILFSCSTDIRLIKYRKIELADPNTFHIIINADFGNEGGTGDILAADSKHVYYGGRLVSNGDPATLKVYDNWAKDKNNIYKNGMATAEANTSATNIIGQYFVKDDKYIHTINSPAQRADIVDYPTFTAKSSSDNSKEILDYAAEDKNFIYINDAGAIKILKAKPGVSNFSKLGCGFYNFKDKIYNGLYELKGVNPKTFKIVSKPSVYAKNIDECDDGFATDGVKRWRYELEILPDDSIGNRDFNIASSLDNTR